MRIEKKQIVSDIQAIIKPAVGYFMVTYKGLTVEEFTELRTKLVAVEGECHVIPNKLFIKAVEGLGYDEISKQELKGDTAIVSGTGDIVALAKVIKSFAKAHPKMKHKFGVVDGKVCTANEAIKLADLPSREVLLAQLLGLLEAPASQLVRVLNAVNSGIVNVINAYKKEKENAA